MSNHRFVLLLLLAGYIFTPTLFSWVINPKGAWYKPFIVWAIVIVGVYLFQKLNARRNDI